MTLDEAIEHCENVAAKCFAERSARNHSGKCGFEHLELAEWLRELKTYKEQEPCEDAISRKSVDALVDELARAISDERLRIPRGRSAGEIMQDILDLPSVTPKQKTGEWIDIKDQKPETYENVLVRDIDGDVTCAYAVDDIRSVGIEFYERFSGEQVDDVVEWREIP